MGKINYEIEIEIFRDKGCDHHRKGDKYRYPEDIGHICPWLMDSINSMIRVLQFGGTLPWKYKATKYEKAIDALIPIAEKEAVEKVEAIGMLSEPRLGAEGKTYNHCFKTQFFHESMTRLAIEAGIRNF